MTLNRIVLLLFISTLLIMCFHLLTNQHDDENQYYKEIMKKRALKNRVFQNAPENQSPIPKKEKASFSGLNYFLPNRDYKVQATLHKMQKDSVYTFQNSKKNTQKIYGILKFEIKQQQFELIALQAPLLKNKLFVPFTDKTSGRETYGAGRYLDVYRTKDQYVTIDFNLAYNPSCAYNKNYNCPLPPPENHLSVRIEAGEKIYKPH